MSHTRRPRLAYISTISLTPWLFLRGQNAYMAERGFELHVITSPGPLLDRLTERDGVIAHPVLIDRRIAPLADLAALIKIYHVLRRIKPDIVHLSTPKAAFLGALAAWGAGVPIRLFLVRGLHIENTRGLTRFVFWLIEWLTARLCHQIICVSRSLLELARNEGILRHDEGIVLSNGMSNGVDATRFDPDRLLPVPIPPPHVTLAADPVIIGFVGRLTLDKGINEIAAAWGRIRDEFPAACLLLIGPWEHEEEISPDVKHNLQSDKRAWIVGYTEDVVPYYRLMSLFVYPSHGTEGFPNAPMEAAAMRLPVIATHMAGCEDAVQEDVTGMLIPAHDDAALTDAIHRYLSDPALRQLHGRAGRERVLRDFRPEAIWSAIYQEYLELLSARNLPLPKVAK